MFTLTVKIKTGSSWPHDVDKVVYGPFETSKEAHAFYRDNQNSDGVKFEDDFHVSQVDYLWNDPTRTGYSSNYRA